MRMPPVKTKAQTTFATVDNVGSTTIDKIAVQKSKTVIIAVFISISQRLVTCRELNWSQPQTLSPEHVHRIESVPD